MLKELKSCYKLAFFANYHVKIEMLYLLKMFYKVIYEKTVQLASRCPLDIPTGININYDW